MACSGWRDPDPERWVPMGLPRAVVRRASRMSRLDRPHIRRRCCWRTRRPERIESSRPETNPISIERSRASSRQHVVCWLSHLGTGGCGHAKPTQESWPRYVEVDEHERAEARPGTPTRVADRSSDEGNPRVESLTLWQHEVLKFSLLVALWDLVREKRSGPLGQLVRWHERPVSVSVPSFGLVRLRLAPMFAQATWCWHRWRFLDCGFPLAPRGG